MITRLASLIIVLLLIGCQQAIVAQESGQGIISTPVKPKINEQLEINREALLNGSSEQIRIKAATVILYNESPEARQVLMDVLDRSDNTAALSAVFKAMIQTRSNQHPLPEKEQFTKQLLKALTSQETDISKLAAEAMLVFDYDVIGASLEKLATDTTQPLKSRLNALYALQLQPNKRAAITIMAMADDPDETIASESRRILRSIGIPVGKDAFARQQIISELERKNKSEFLRDWLVRQEERMRQERAETELWRQLFLETLDKLYEISTDKTIRAGLLLTHLQAPQPARKLWALKKIYQWRVAPGEALPEEFRPVLIQLISDNTKDVRLQTAKLLSLMGEICPPDRLLTQLDKEQDEEVKASLFVALRIACDYALGPDSGIKIPSETKIETLEWAGQFLAYDDPTRAREGAIVIRMLLEKNGVGSEQIDKYIELLAERFNQLQNHPEAALRADLIQVMASLCSSKSACKDLARKRYASLFELARSDENQKIREYALDGLINIDKQRVFKELRNDFMNDSNPKIRARIMGLASEQGDPKDLEWLSLRLGSTPDQDVAWQAMTAIFLRNNAKVIQEWLERFKDSAATVRLTTEQWLAFLDLAARKAEGKPDLLNLIHKELADYHLQKGELEAAEPYLKELLMTSNWEQYEIYAGELLGIYLRLEQIEDASQLIQEVINKKDLDGENWVERSIEDYLQEPEDKIRHYEVVDLTIKSTKISNERPQWGLFKKRWQDQYASLKAIQDPNSGSVRKSKGINNEESG